MRFKYKNEFDKRRRDLFKTITSAGISSGLLRSCGLVGGMMIARAAEAQGARKHLLLLTVGGAPDSEWRPSGSRMGAVSAPYDDVKQHMNFIAGGSMTQGGHGLMFERFTGGSFQAGDDSFDANIGKTIGADYPLRYLNLGVQTAANNLTVESVGGTRNEIPSIDDPRSAFSRLTLAAGGSGGGGGGSSSGGGSSPRQMYVDVHKEAIDALRVKLGQHEREKLESHLDAIEEVERGIAGSGSSSSGGTSTPPPPSGDSCTLTQPNASGEAGNLFDQTAKNQIAIAVLALRCNITASVSLAFGNDSHGFNIPGYNDVFHQSHHCCNEALDPYVTTARYMCGLAAETIRQADAAGLLSETIITQVTDMGDARAHNNTNVPMFVAGAGVRGGSVTNASGRRSVDLFQGVSDALGVSSHPQARNWSSSPISI